MYGIHLVDDVKYDVWHMPCLMYGKRLVYDVLYNEWHLWLVVCGIHLVNDVSYDVWHMRYVIMANVWFMMFRTMCGICGVRCVAYIW